MQVAKIGIKSFVHWLKKYNHNDSYSNVGEALISWCINNHGAETLGFNYEIFLQMVILN
jgi:hypothetical protein